MPSPFCHTHTKCTEHKTLASIRFLSARKYSSGTPGLASVHLKAFRMFLKYRKCVVLVDKSHQGLAMPHWLVDETCAGAKPGRATPLPELSAAGHLCWLRR